MSETKAETEAWKRWPANHGYGTSGQKRDAFVAGALWQAAQVSEADKRGESIWFDFDQWGVIVDALIEHKTSAEVRTGNPAKTNLARVDICAAVIRKIHDDARLDLT